ncbi:hypothetical protein B7494_g6511 [Chlorociboria aeruginascens]|nr:hypothetical protein B7494_g6511 [Chlorociboria aeruginascens]
MASQGEDVYATLLLNDFYLPGALVLAHSLKDAGTTKKLAVLVTTDSVSADAMVELQKVYDFIIPVDRVVNEVPANLYLMNRPDLHSTFTKIALWRQLQFRKIVYVDADIVALRAPDELFELSQPFSAAPDIGWPDLFNTGLMVLTPNMGDYYALLAMAQRGISFDGADQGLLNMHFKNSYNRISFTYNVTPSAHYQYLPAYRHFQSSISLAHFIGAEKPWKQGREANRGATPYDEMVARWWAVYDRHFRESSVDSSAHGISPTVQYYVKGEFNPIVPIVSITQSESEISHPAVEPPMHETSEIAQEVEEVRETYVPPVETSVEEKQEDRQEIPYYTWDASRDPPPSDSKPEASNFPVTQYNMSSDPTPFKAPERYPDPPKDMYYEVPKTPKYQKPTPIFPWEKDAPKPTRVFPEDNLEVTEPTISEPEVDTPPEMDTIVASATPTFKLTPADPWQTYSRGNAWDDIPEIERYIGHLQKNRKGNIQVLQGYGTGIEQVSSPGGRTQSLKLTDFPTELERPSLPVTPAPIHRPSFWGDERDAEGELPAAEGVPAQEDDPTAQLEMLAKRQSDVLASKLGNGREIPSRPLPYGSEGVQSPTYVAPSPKKIEEPSYHGPSATFEKNENFPISETPLGPSEEELDVLQT